MGGNGCGRGGGLQLLAPDTGNMEVLHRQRQPEKQGSNRPCRQDTFGILQTEPAVALSDATNMALSIAKCADGGYELNGRKWWISGVMEFASC